MPEMRHSRTEAVSVALRATALDRRRLRTPAAVLEHLGAVQLDTIAVLARSQELVAHARLGAVGRERIHDAYWGNGRTFEYWSHEACVLPMEVHPWFAFRRQHGYFAMPVLHAGAIIGLIDPAREGDALVARNISTASRDPEGFAIALADAARWVGKSRVTIEQAPTKSMARDVARMANALLRTPEAPGTPPVPPR